VLVHRRDIFFFTLPLRESQKHTPVFYPEGDTPIQFDSEQRSLQKIVSLGAGGGGGGGAGEFGVGSPEGVVTADPGTTYVTAAGGLWAKVSGAGNTGWIVLIAE
jgi:hypothetical protein